MKFKEWLQVIATMLILVTTAGSVGVWAGDHRWVTASNLDKIIVQLEINALDRQITFLQIKVNQGEASNSEKIYMETLKQQLRAMQ
ncbi:MAG: hypothetical protein KAQ67_07565 [Gammaproteobacteria bacterium]|nr:hypothetical protein [Gammaproteobacteria bacterium]